MEKAPGGGRAEALLWLPASPHFQPQDSRKEGPRGEWREAAERGGLKEWLGSQRGADGGRQPGGRVGVRGRACGAGGQGRLSCGSGGCQPRMQPQSPPSAAACLE